MEREKERERERERESGGGRKIGGDMGERRERGKIKGGEKEETERWGKGEREEA